MISDIIFFLLRKGAHHEPKRITTSEVAESIGVSQQTASRKLIHLEKSGLLQRTGGKVMLTENAISDIRRHLKEMLESLEGVSITFAGSVVQGVGEGAYYLSQKGYSAQFSKRLGFKPFAGTLNVTIADDDIEKRIMLRQQKPMVISGFKKGNRTFGKIEAYRCAVGGIPCAIVFPERSVHGLRVLEIISHIQLRKKLNLTDGSKVTVEVVAN